jgi:peptide deformylase
MVKEIITYPTVPSLEFGANVRFFDESLFSLIQDLKDTMEANNVNALAAYQIGSPLGVIVIKQEDGNSLELINPRVITREGSVMPTEATAYFPGLTGKTKRYEKIKLTYEDRDEQQQFLEADGDLAITIQRKIDYLYGSNFRVRMNKEDKEHFDSKLEHGTDAIMKNDCPTVFKRDRILHLFKFAFIVGILGVISKFFLSAEHIKILTSAENYLMLFMLFLLVVYFFYAQYEGKQYKHCTSCQIGNIIGTTAISASKLLILFLLTYFLL